MLEQWLAVEAMHKRHYTRKSAVLYSAWLRVRNSAGIAIVIPSLFSAHKTSIHRPMWAHLVKRKKDSHKSYSGSLHNSGVATIFLHCSRCGWHNRNVFSFQRNWPWYLKLGSKFSHYDISKIGVKNQIK